MPDKKLKFQSPLLPTTLLPDTNNEGGRRKSSILKHTVPSKAEKDLDGAKNLHTSEPEAAEREYVPKFQILWADYVNRVKVHELLRCLQAEYAKLKILRGHSNLDDLLEERATESEHDVSFGSTENKAKVKKNMNNILFMRSLKDESDAMGAIYPDIKQALADPKYISQSAAKILKTRAFISDEEFEEIMSLCEDKIDQKTLRDAFQEKRSREKYLHKANERRRMIYDFINSYFFTKLMLFSIVVSIVGIILMTFENVAIHFVYPLVMMDSCIIGIFVVEATLKIFIYREDYFKMIWNIFDVVIIGIHFVEVFVDLVTKTLGLSTDISTVIYFKFLKSLRALRLLRVIKFLPNLQVIVSTVFQSFLSLGSIAVLMCLFMFVFAVMGRGLFNEDDPEHFGNTTKTFLTLFTLLTLDDWFDLLDKVERVGDASKDYTQFWVMFGYLFFYIVIEYFVFLNLFVAVLVDNFQLSLAEAEFQRQKESLDFGDEQDKFQALQEDEAEDGNLSDESDEQIGETNFELNVDEYFPLPKRSKEAILLENILKNMTSIDFKNFIWRRRLAILNTVMDEALLPSTNIPVDEEFSKIEAAIRDGRIIPGIKDAQTAAVD